MWPIKYNYLLYSLFLVVVRYFDENQVCSIKTTWQRESLSILSTVDAGHRAVIFDRFRGVQETVAGEGTHFIIPWVQKPIIFDCRSRPRNVPVITGSKGTGISYLAIAPLPPAFA